MEKKSFSCTALCNSLPENMTDCKSLNTFKVTVQFESEGNGQNEIVGHKDRSKVKL